MSKYSSYLLYLLTSILVVLLYINGFGPLDDLQRTVDDMLCRITAPEGRRPNIAIVTIDGPSFDKYGQWPWNNDILGDLTAAVGTGSPKTVVLDVDIQEDAAQDSAGYTQVLADQISWVKNVVLPYDIALSTYRTNKTNNPANLFDYSVQVENPLGLMNENSSLQARKVFLPAEKVVAQKPILGFNYQMPDDDRVLRHQPMVINFEGYYYPSLSLIASANYLGVPADQIMVVEGKEIRIGQKRTIPIDNTSEMYIAYGKGRSFERYSAADVLGDGFDLKKFKDKLVVIAVDDPGQTLFYQTPAQSDTPDYVIRASVIENIIHGNILVRRDDMAGLSMLILFVVGGICAFVLSRVTILYRTIILLAGLIVLANINYFMISSFKTIIESVYIGFELLLFMLVAPVLDSKMFAAETSQKREARPGLPKVEVKKVHKTENAESVKERHIKASSDDPENQPTTVIQTESEAPEDHQSINIDDVSLYHTGDTTLAVEKTAALDEKTLEEVMEDETIPSSEEKLNDSTPTPIPGHMGPITQLGRYQITGTLGKGAMGHVYKGVDPAINRPVALKTIRLDFINDQNEMEELKERLHREAQAAGKLSHPNIVTIYDVGSDGSLQYIAMEYLEGKTLEEMIKKKAKFNYRILSQIVQQICSALQYAHEQNIVHRDIKPANIMITKDYRVKVMDFGIARIDSNSMTKTGIAMGTPNYISPEQLQGKPVDHRADIFSLGVVLYELLIGRRPFRGENITSLIYAILHHEPEKPSNLIAAIPFLFDQIVARALEKDPAKRYQSAKELSNQLSDFVEAFSSKG